MAIVATLIAPLAYTGSRKSDGSVNASGTVYCYTVGTTSQVTVYSDESATTAHSQPITLDSAGKATIYATTPVKVVIQDSSGATVDTITIGNEVMATQVAVENTGFTGTLATGASGLGGKTWLNSILSGVSTSLGGTDFSYLESSSATARYFKDRLGQSHVSVKDYGATGDGATDDTSAIQAAINRVSVRGGGIVFFPRGNYLISSALAVTTDSIRLVGASTSYDTATAGSVITSNSGTAAMITMTAADFCSIERLAFTHSSSSTGNCITLAGCKHTLIDRIFMTGNLWTRGIDITPSGATTFTNITIRNSFIRCLGTAATDCIIRIGQGSTGSDGRVVIDDCVLGMGSTGVAGVAIGGTATDVTISRCQFTSSGTNYVLIPSGATVVTAHTGRANVRVFGCYFSPGASTTIFNITQTGAVGFAEWGNSGIHAGTLVYSDSSDDAQFLSYEWNMRPLGQRLGNTATISDATNFTPNLDKGNVFRVTLDNAASACTVQTPSTTTTVAEGMTVTIVIITTAGVTTSALAAGYINNTGVSPTTTNGRVFTCTAMRTNSKWYVLYATVGPT